MKENNRALTGANKCFEPEYLQKTLVQAGKKKKSFNPLTPKIWLIINSPLQMTHISLYISYENLLLDQDNFW